MKAILVSILIACGCTAYAETCDGRYAETRTFIEKAYAEYGTLYSGGLAHESLGPPLEIYRLMMGLPDSGMATRRADGAPFVDPGGHFSDPVFVNATLERSLPRIHDPLFRRDGHNGSTDSEVLLNLLTVVGPYPGWWLTPDAPHLTDVEQVIASHADDDALDWLLSIQAASTRPHVLSWHLQPRARSGRINASRTVFTHSLDQYSKTGSLPWLVAVLLNWETPYWVLRMDSSQDLALDAIEQRLDAITDAVSNCTADGAEYATFAIGLYEQIRLGRTVRGHLMPDVETMQLLPPMLRRMAAVQLAKIGLPRTMRYGSRLAPDELRRLADDPSFDRWLNVGLSYDADTLDAMIAVNEGVALDPKTMRLLNILSADDLLTFAMSRQAFPTEYRDLITAAFLRFFALRRDEQAAALVGDITALWPERADGVGAAWAQDGSLGYRLAQVALILPEPRTLLAPEWKSWRDLGAFADNLQSDFGLLFWTRARRSRDLPLAIRTGGFLSRDLRFWMETVGSRPNAGWALKRRARRRGDPLPDALTGVRPPLPERGSYFGPDLSAGKVGLVGFAGWDELAQLGPQTGLANRIGQELVANARLQTAGIFRGLFADQETLALEMAIVIEQGRRMIHGEMEGRPLGQVAFEVLHGRLGRTEVAARTPYWYICRERCEP